MNQHNVSTVMATDADDDYSFREDLAAKGKRLRFALRQWKWWGSAALLGMVIGATYAYLKPVTYVARTTFVVEDTKSSGGMLSAIAGQFGFDVGSMAGGGSGVLAGDNVLELLKSRSLIKKTLLTRTDSSSMETLADRYASSKHWQEKWAKSKKVGYAVKFMPGKQKGRVEDSLLQVIIKHVVEEDLSVAKPDRKLGFFELNVTMRDELLAEQFSRRLLKTAIDFFIDTRTRRLSTNVARLQGKADTLERVLNRKTYSAAASGKMLLDLNPVYTTPDAVAEISGRDKAVQSAIYAEVMKNLEISRTALIQETPTVQVVDEPELPLKKNKAPLILIMGMTALLVAAVTLFVLSIFIGYKS
ncbi:Chain length determinant protein [Cnuella takakiae]|uniref:Chain length determinant protein n=1 Tax=Cnuella takakiae TaxID=1302690 RepID=A0A1M5B9G5_9BACT|nr:hypothetical protein [Cnuella takakiae]OLY93393.1 hypothetical protein BUE76_17015 [Cnuella takakiae]SHF39163.1 Chain length determinant protein [Cnuella takakiae]